MNRMLILFYKALFFNALGTTCEYFTTLIG